MFIILPVGMNYKTQRLPVVTFTLMGLNTLIYVISLGFFLAQGEDAELWTYEHLWLIPALSSWHTYLTSMFVHAGFFHLLGNMVYLFLFGCCVEDMIGRAGFAALYLLGGLASQLVYIAFIPEHFASAIPMGGASGAISACMGAYLLLRAKVAIDFRYFALIFFRLFSGEFSLAAWIVISFWFLKDLFFAALSYYVGKGVGGVAFGAHVGGFLAGMSFLGLFKLMSRKPVAPARGPIRIHLPASARIVPEPQTEVEWIPLDTEQPALFLWDGTAQTGPFTLFQIQQMLSQGTITAQAQYWGEGMTEWHSVTELTASTA